MYQTDPEERALFPAASDWRKFLHPDLAPELAIMLGEMHRYLQPEWAMLPDLRPDHAHEALRRLVFKEIVRMKESGNLAPISERKRPIHPEVESKAEEIAFDRDFNPFTPEELVSAIKQLGSNA
ncbi:hypothetical protein FS749_006705 [Ceratobasidium sp. UAMH 11750]|nr:hypothetical protein FS749_006705 [Ceratobasidium sp. UAMH 11750]